MKDTRLVHILNAIIDVEAQVADVLDESPQSEDREHLERALAWLGRARLFVARSAKGMACNHGQTCRRTLGHAGAHTKIRAVR